MQTKLIEHDGKFKPFEINIKFETLLEAKAFRNLFNCFIVDLLLYDYELNDFFAEEIRNAIDEGCGVDITDKDYSEFWDVLYRKIKDIVDEVENEKSYEN